MNHCYFDKRGMWHMCDNPQDCIGCKYERVIAKTWVTICQWCGNEISANKCKSFCNNDHKNLFLQNSLAYNKGIDRSPLFGQPIFTVEQCKEVQKQMLGISLIK